MQIIGTLAQKRHGAMMLGIDYDSRCHCAIKATSAQFITDREQTGRRALNEKRMLEMLGDAPSPFVVSYVCAFADVNYLYLGMTYVGGGDLFSRLMPAEVGGGADEALTTLGEEEVALYASQIVLAIEHLHGHHVMHRNLKLDNLLVGMDGFLVLTAFGMAKSLPADHSARCATLCGSPEYIAPEVLLGRAYNHLVDYWSLGCVVYELLCGRTPFSAAGQVPQIVANVIDGQYALPLSLSPEAQGLIGALLQPPHCRLEGVAVEQHPFFAHLDWRAVASKAVQPHWKPGTAGAMPQEAVMDTREELDDQIDELCWQTFEELATQFPPLPGAEFPFPPAHFTADQVRNHPSAVTSLPAESVQAHHPKLIGLGDGTVAEPQCCWQLPQQQPAQQSQQPQPQEQQQLQPLPPPLVPAPPAPSTALATHSPDTVISRPGDGGLSEGVSLAGKPGEAPYPAPPRVRPGGCEGWGNESRSPRSQRASREETTS